ncbi:MAG: (2Fe-2S)-binding protein [Labrenzia sp.]
MFERILKDSNETADFVFFFEGKEVHARKGDTVAAALLNASILSFRKTPVSGAHRGPYCMMGACFDCLVSVDGVVLQACMTPAKPLLKVTRPKSIVNNKGGDDGEA